MILASSETLLKRQSNQGLCSAMANLFIRYTNIELTNPNPVGSHHTLCVLEVQHVLKLYGASAL